MAANNRNSHQPIAPAPLTNTTYLGRGPQGHTYWRGSDHCQLGQKYVWQVKPDGTLNGWLCTIDIWDSPIWQRGFVKGVTMEGVVAP